MISIQTEIGQLGDPWEKDQAFPFHTWAYALLSNLWHRHIEFQKNNIDKAMKIYKEAIDLCGDIDKFKIAYNNDVQDLKELGLDDQLYLSLLEKLVVY